MGICEDINECVEDNVLCAFRCHNTPGEPITIDFDYARWLKSMISYGINWLQFILGSYRCVCPYGYAVAPDRMHCEDIDECSTEANDCRYDCKNLIGSFM